VSGRASLGSDLSGVATAVVDFVAFVFLGWLVAGAYLAHVPASSLLGSDFPLVRTPGPPLWGWLLVLAGLALAFTVPLSARLGSHRSVSSGVRVTMIVIPVSFCAQLVFSGARWSSFSGLVVAAGWCLCLIASIMTARATREPEAADAVGD
jgi:hypothetical protein